MQLKQRTLAVLTATSLLVACSDEPKKSDKGTKTEQTAVKPADLAQQAEDRYRANLALASETYQKMYAQNPLRGIQKYEITASDYQRGENSATSNSPRTSSAVTTLAPSPWTATTPSPTTRNCSTKASSPVLKTTSTPSIWTA